jgi:hypothetical protein
MMVLFFLSIPTLAQNTKGDKAEVNTPRQTRFKGKPSKKQKGKQSYNRITPNRYSLANSARSFDKPRKQSGGGKDNIFPQHGPFVNNPSPYPKNKQRAVSNRRTLARLNRLQGSSKSKPPGKKKIVTPRSASSSFIRHKTINANAGFWNVKRKGEQATTTDLAGKPLRSRNFRTPPQEVIPQTSPYYRQKKKMGDRPYAGSSAKVYKIKPRTSQKAWTGDIAGRKIRGRNYSSTKKNGPGEGEWKGTYPRTSEHNFRGTIPGGGHKSATGPGEKRPGKYPLPVRVPGVGANGVNYSGRLKGGKPVKGGGSRSGKNWNNNGFAIQPKTPGIGADGIGTFQGKIKGGKPVKGGGSRSGRHWNNNGFAVQPKTPGIGADRVGTFQGNIKRIRPLKGGGSISGRSWNNRRSPVAVRTPPESAAKAGGFPGKIKRFQLSPGFNNQGEEFTGFIKTKRPVKGGGSKSGRLWNNNGIALQPKTPGAGANRIGTFQGNIKGGKPVKGGGSVSGRMWNNKGYAIQPKIPGKGAMGVGTFQGNIKAGKPVKGGGSISGKLWNNKETAIPSKTPSATQLRMGRWQGNKIIFDQSPLFQNQGEEFTGYIKLPKFKKTYKQNPKAVEESGLKRRPNKRAYEVEDMQVKVQRRKYIVNKDLPEEATKKLKPTEVTTNIDNLKIKIERRKYVVNKNSAELALKKLKPTALTKEIDNLTSKTERRRYVVNKNSAELALKKLKPTDVTKQADNLTAKVKQYHYIHNSSSSKEALNVREPGKAFAKSTDYQGNIKMKKFELAKLFSERNKHLHPDAQFVKTNKNNVKEERSLLTNIKLWWGRKFRKNETQPEHLKEKIRKPRYDKGEDGMWNE